MIPWMKILRNTVAITTDSMIGFPGITYFCPIKMRPRTIEDNPLGPNQPRKSIDAGFKCVPISEIATGSKRTNVKLSIARAKNHFSDKASILVKLKKVEKRESGFRRIFCRLDSTISDDYS